MTASTHRNDRLCKVGCHHAIGHWETGNINNSDTDPTLSALDSSQIVSQWRYPVRQEMKGTVRLVVIWEELFTTRSQLPNMKLLISCLIFRIWAKLSSTHQNTLITLEMYTTLTHMTYLMDQISSWVSPLELTLSSVAYCTCSVSWQLSLLEALYSRRFCQNLQWYSHVFNITQLSSASIYNI